LAKLFGTISGCREAIEIAPTSQGVLNGNYTGTLTPSNGLFSDDESGESTKTSPRKRNRRRQPSPDLVDRLA
jgi:hypothetical protein